MTSERRDEQQPVGPVITTEMYGYRVDTLYREVESRLSSEAAKAAHGAAGWIADAVREAYLRGLQDGFAQGSLASVSRTEKP
jgi:hypothetical protein